MIQNISIFMILIWTSFSVSTVYGATIQYQSTVKISVNSGLEFKQKKIVEKRFKPRRKWVQKIIRNAEKWIIGGILTLTAVFVSLKIMQIIAWSWLWVLSPIWITIALLILLFIYIIILFLTLPEKPKMSEIKPVE